MARSPIWSWFRSGKNSKSDQPAALVVRHPVFMGEAVPYSEDYRSLLRSAGTLPDGALVEAALLLVIEGEVERRRRITGTLEGPRRPEVTGLTLRHAGLPDWWQENGNLLLCGTDTSVEIALGYSQIPCRDCLAVVGSGAIPPRLVFEGAGGLVVIGDGCRIVNSAFNAAGESTILIGEGTTATFMASIDVRNGGIVVAGDDNMWAMGVNLMSDDTHAIREIGTNRRINEFGGKIVIERHVWIGNGAQLMGHCRIGHDSVIGQGSFVKNAALPPHTVSVGRPARPLRGGVTWSREDLP